MTDPSVLGHLPLLVAAGWVVRAPLVSRHEGHEAITRAACDGLDLTDGQRAALIRGVRAPDTSLASLLVFTLPFTQPRHALRAWSSTTTPQAVAASRAFVAASHTRALAEPGEGRRWKALGEVLHCLQDSFSPAHAERDGTTVLRMKHWGPMDPIRRAFGAPAEHGFPNDPDDDALVDGQLTPAAADAAEVSRRYLELVLRHAQTDGAAADRRQRDLQDFLDSCLVATSSGRSRTG